jgi:Flp pilus assembly protein TadG
MYVSRIRRDCRGASAVEFAMVLPMLLLVIFCIFECAWLVTTQTLLINAVWQGARAGVKADEWSGESPEDFAKAAAIDAFWLGTLNPGDIEVTVYASDVNLPRRIEVKIPRYSYRGLLRFLPSFVLPDHLGGKAVMPFP